MAPFKDDQILIIAPGSQTTLAQLGLPESLTPARFHFRSCMFAGEKDSEHEPNKVRRKDKPATNGVKPANGASSVQPSGTGQEEIVYEEDLISEAGAVWPIRNGEIVDWPCFYALMTYVYNTINPPFHTAILVIAEPVWTPRQHEKVTSFFFEKFKTPAFGIMDAAVATSYAFGLQNATVVDVGLDKADITAISDFLLHTTGRALAVPNCGGESMTKSLMQLLASKGFTRNMCEQLKKSPICEILAPDTEVPSASSVDSEGVHNPAAAASTGANALGTETDVTPGQRQGTQADQKEAEENDGVLDIASIVTGNNMAGFLERKEKEKAEKLAAKQQHKKGADTAANAPKLVKLPNSKKHKNAFVFEDMALHDAMKEMNVDNKRMAEMQSALSDGASKDGDHIGTDGARTGQGAISREIEVGPERFKAASDGILERLSDTIFRTISSVEDVSRRSELWESLVIVGNGSKVRGFKEALLASLQSKYAISPSSATIFTSELPSNLSTPLATGMNTPQPQLLPQQHSGSHVNPLLLAATTAQNPHLNPMSQGMPNLSQHTHSSHGQTPTSIKLAKIPEYFPEWKEAGYEEAVFLGAQVAAKVLFTVDAGLNKGYMTRTDYNEQGPSGIHDCSY